uniref:Uncharacterized protein n=1 Tax=Glossina austeni TaxID=7395 RepID=A0A1A9VX39_GLOAU
MPGPPKLCGHPRQPLLRLLPFYKLGLIDLRDLDVYCIVLSILGFWLYGGGLLIYGLIELVDWLNDRVKLGIVCKKLKNKKTTMNPKFNVRNCQAAAQTNCCTR